MRNRSRSRSRSRDRSRSGSRDRYRGRHGRSEGQVRAPGGDRDGPRNGNWDRDRDLSDRRNFDHRGVPRGGGSRGRGGREGRRSWRDEHEPNRNADRLKEQSKDIGRETAAVCPAPLPEEVAPPPAESSDEDLADLEWNVGADEEDSLKLEEDRRARKERLAALAARARLENEAARAEAEKAAALDDDDDEIEGEDFNGNDHGTMDIIKEGAPQILPALGLDQQQGENGVASSTVNITGGDLGPGKALEVGGVFDMFSDSPNALPGKPSAAGGSVLMVDEGDNPTLQANWTDQEGYYKARVGEVIEGRYKVLGVIGQGVFSVVLKCLDSSENGTEVALKMIRNNDTMRKAAQKEVALLKEIAEKDPHKKKHCVLLLKHLEHRNHTVMVFESLQMNLRETLKKFGRKVGINITAVRSYAKQLFIALKHLAALQIIHADIKPDNILVSQG
jgi:serine/threonine-protein kinase PRP4